MADRTPLADPQWYAIHTMAGLEAKAARNLNRRGFHTWYPFDRYRVKIKQSGTTIRLDTWIERPHFSRYIFAALRFTDEAVGEINDTDGVARVVCERFSGVPLRIPNDIMDLLMDSALITYADARGSALISSDLVKLLPRGGNEELVKLVKSLGRWVLDDVAA